MKLRINRTISILYRYGQRFLATRLRPLGIEVGQFPSLMRVYSTRGITQEQISFETGMDKGTTARSVQQLEKNGLIFRKSDPSDRRMNHIFLTEKGEKLEPEVYAAADALHEVLYRGFTSEEIELTGSFLNRMKKNLADEIGRKPSKAESTRPEE